MSINWEDDEQEPLLRCVELVTEANPSNVLGFQISMRALVWVSHDGGWGWDTYGEIETDNPDQMKALNAWMRNGNTITAKELFNVQQSPDMGTENNRAGQTRAVSAWQAKPS